MSAPTADVSDAVIPPCPTWLLDAAYDQAQADGQGGETPGGAHPPTSGPSPASPKLDQRIRAYLAKCVTEGVAVSGQGGHSKTMEVARAVVWGYAVGEEAGFAYLWELWNPHCQPPWSEKELRHKCREADTKPFGKPRGYLLSVQEDPMGYTKPSANGHAHTNTGPPPKPPPQPPPKASGQEPPVAKPVKLASVQVRAVEWLWYGWLPMGKQVMLDGDPDLGKSTVLLDIAARVSKDGVMPDGTQGVAGNVLILSAEDDPEDTIAPRLLAAGADPDRIHLLNDIGGFPPVIPGHFPQIDRVIEELNVQLVIFDPLMAYLNCKAVSDQEVRQALHPWKIILQKRRCCSVSLRHLNKGSGTKALYRGGGSIGLIANARAGILVAQDPDSPAHRVFAQTKHNVGPDMPSLRYALEWREEQQACVVGWVSGPCAYKADDLLKGPEEPEVKGALDEATLYLQTVLGGLGEVPSAEVIDQAKELKISEKTLRRAAKLIGVKSKPIKDPGGKLLGWRWSLPGWPSGPSGDSESP